MYLSDKGYQKFLDRPYLKFADFNFECSLSNIKLGLHGVSHKIYTDLLPVERLAESEAIEAILKKNKNFGEFLRVLLPLVNSLIVTQPHMDRAMSADALAQAVLGDDLVLSVILNPWEAYCKARDSVDPSDLICVTGSLFLVGEVLQHLAPPHSPMVQR